MPPLQPISWPKQLLVEGFDAARLLQALVGHLKLGDIQVQNFGGNWELAAFLSALRALPNFEAQVTSVGIVRDADANPAAAFQSVRAALRKAGLEALDRPGIPTETNPRTAVFILPDGETPGMLESLCLAAVEGEPDDRVRGQVRSLHHQRNRCSTQEPRESASICLPGCATQTWLAPGRSGRGRRLAVGSPRVRSAERFPASIVT